MTADRSLDSLASGEIATIEQILFDALRQYCADRGIREGTRVNGATGDAECVVVETSDGPIPCERRYARFIQVASGTGPGGDFNGTQD